MARPGSPGDGRQRLFVIVNPHASAVDPSLRSLVVAALSSRFDVTALDTERPGSATELAREAVQQGADAVVAVGGDGTVNEVAGGLAGTRTALVPLPGGSQNVYAKLLGLPADVVEATSLVLRLPDPLPVRSVDLGTVNDRVFAFCAGAGIDADTVEIVDATPERKARWREWYYMATVGQVAARRYVRRPPEITVTSGGRSVRGITVLIQNGPSYTYAGERPIEACPAVSLDDGRLSAAVLLKGLAGLPTVALRLYSQKLSAERHRGIENFDHVDSLSVRAAPGETFAIQADGDFMGRFAQASFGVLPGALSVVDAGQADGVTR
jgi:diacylglycerol kinase family enzyme